MIFHIYSVFDKKSKQFCPLFLQREGAVERSVSSIVQRGHVPAVDLYLRDFGTFDDESGMILLHPDTRITEVSDFFTVEEVSK